MVPPGKGLVVEKDVLGDSVDIELVEKDVLGDSVDIDGRVDDKVTGTEALSDSEDDMTVDKRYSAVRK